MMNKENTLLIENFDIVKSLAGRDKNKSFLVIYSDKDYLYIVDGKIRKLEKPKKKKYKHCCLIKKNIKIDYKSLSNKIIINIIRGG